MSVILQKAKLMTRYFQLRALSSISDTPDFKIGDVVWGKGFLSIVDDSPVIDDIPDDISVIQGEFHRSKPILSYLNGVITLRATIAKGGLAEGVNSEFNTLYLLDSADRILAVFVVQPIYMNRNRGITVEGVISEVVS